ncbi:MAG: hypothetical protein CMJ72_05195 [Planctomycetaceae bacterium]|nr:hypothetical protein [Planctomycetaceae bacterium]HCK41865.1 hypothetical protein [Planctomycetaceae bacterium]
MDPLPFDSKSSARPKVPGRVRFASACAANDRGCINRRPISLPHISVGLCGRYEMMRTSPKLKYQFRKDEKILK